MKVAISMSRLTWGAGAQKVVVGLSNYLNERGHEVILIGFEHIIPRGEKSFFPVNPGVSIETVVRPIPFSSDLSEDIDRHAMRLNSNLSKAIGRHTIHYAIRDEILCYSWYIPVIRQLANILVKTKPDLVVGVLPTTFTAIAMLLEGTEIPLVIDNQNDPWTDYAKSRFSKNTFDVKRRKLAPHQSIANIVLLEKDKAFFSSEIQKKTSVIPNPLDHMPTTEDLQEDRQPVILSASRLEPQKNLAMLIEAFAKIAHRNPKWQVHLYGEGKLENELREQIKRLNLDNKVFIMGQTKKIHEKYKSASIYAQPSIHEGLSLAMLEAMAHKLPSVVIEECASNNYLVSESHGGLVSKNTVTSISKDLEKLIENEQLREKLGDNARKYAARFEADIVFAQWENLLLNLQKKHRMARPSDYKLLKDRELILERRYSELLMKAVYAQKDEIERQKSLFHTKKKQLDEAINSRAFKVGNAILSPPRKLKAYKKSTR